MSTKPLIYEQMDGRIERKPVDAKVVTTKTNTQIATFSPYPGGDLPNSSRILLPHR